MKKIGIVTAAIFLIVVIFQQLKPQISMSDINKKVNVWDTYVTKKDASVMHFDILAPVEISDTATIYEYGKDYLKTKGQEGQPLSSKQCRLCHIETLRPAWKKEIEAKGYYIIEMEGCD